MANTTAREQEENYLDRIKVLERELEEANERLKRVGCTLDRERHEDSSPWDGRGHRLNKEQVETLQQTNNSSQLWSTRCVVCHV